VTVKVKRPVRPGSTNGWSSGVARPRLIQEELAKELSRSRGLLVPRRTTSLVHVAVPTLRASKYDVAL
jgi:hypothetical protein